MTSYGGIGGMGLGSLVKLTICAAAVLISVAGAAPQLFEWQDHESGFDESIYRAPKDNCT